MREVVKAWDDNNPNLYELYKLQRNNPRNKSRIEIHKFNGKYGIEYTIDKTIPEFNKGDLNRSDTFVEFENVLQGHHKRPGNRCFTSTSQSLLMQQCWYQLHKIVAGKKASTKLFSSLFNGC
jgi:hypothetical protein